MDNRPRASSISAIFPAYNDGGTIPSMILAALIALREVTDDYEIIVTDDGSDDYSPNVLDEMERRFPELRVIHHPRNCGYGAALRTGFSAATKDWIFYTDGDAQYNPLELSALVYALSDDTDVVNGYKITRHDPLIRKIIGRFYHYFVSVLFGIHLRDVDCDFRLMRRKELDALQLESVSGAICVEMVKKLQDRGCKFVEVPVHHYHRQYGRSQFFNFRRIFRIFRQLIKLYWKLVLHKEHFAADHVKAKST
jgi:glycosyltransferase involved in cell wall biosynthesis